jgi:hypothetical protein
VCGRARDEGRYQQEHFAQNLENTDLSDVDVSSAAVVLLRHCRNYFVLLLSLLFLLLNEQKINIELSLLHTPKLQRACW